MFYYTARYQNAAMFTFVVCVAILVREVRDDNIATGLIVVLAVVLYTFSGTLSYTPAMQIAVLYGLHTCTKPREEGVPVN